jgi:iron complex transport system substrate-binding protein
MMDKRCIVLLTVLAQPVAAAPERAVSLSPDVTELVVALHAERQLVGRDLLARQAEVAQVPVIGSSRALTVAPILAMRPEVVLGSTLAQPASIYAQLSRAGVRVVEIEHAEDVEGFARGMREVGHALGKDAAADRLADEWLAGMRPRPALGRRVLLSYDGRLVAGQGTAGDALIRAAGGTNAAAALTGIVPLSPEAWLHAAPDLLIVAQHNLAAFGGLAALRARPELRDSPAVRHGRVLAWPAADFLRLGVHSPQVADRLRRQLLP